MNLTCFLQQVNLHIATMTEEQLKLFILDTARTLSEKKREEFLREIDYIKTTERLCNNEILKIVSMIHEYKGSQNLFIEAKPDILNSLMEVAKIQSTQSSNRIEGIYTSDKRMREIVEKKSEPHNRNEGEISGYRDVLSTIHESYDYIPPRSNLILQLHRDLYKFTTSAIGGSYKNSDNVISEKHEDGTVFIRFQPVSAFETERAMETICDKFIEEINKNSIDPLLLIPVFILDFLCIHPFHDGNGRMSRLLTLLLLYRSGYIVGKYISIEMIIEQTKETYYDSLQTSSQEWHTAENNYMPFVQYYLGIILSAYREFSSRVEHLSIQKISKPERVRIILEQNIGQMSKQDIIFKCPDISKGTVEKTLGTLVKNKIINKLNSGISTAYIYRRE